jgi:mono/diheme cytochrome c family protein
MKKILIVSSFTVVSVLLAYCCGPKKVAATPSVTGAAEAPKVVEVPKSTFESGVSAVVMANCAPCHIPSKGGNKRPYDNFTNVKADIDEIIRRVSLNPTDRGFMPMKGQKLSDETIAVFKKWKADGSMEK